jgi:hypothetical protein
MRPRNEQREMVKAWLKSGLNKDDVLRRCQEDLGKIEGKKLFEETMLVLVMEEGHKLVRMLMTPQERALEDVQHLLCQYEDGLETTNNTFNKIWAICSQVHEEERGNG